MLQVILILIPLSFNLQYIHHDATTNSSCIAERIENGKGGEGGGGGDELQLHV